MDHFSYLRRYVFVCSLNRVRLRFNEICTYVSVLYWMKNLHCLLMETVLLFLKFTFNYVHKREIVSKRKFSFEVLNLILSFTRWYIIFMKNLMTSFLFLPKILPPFHPLFTFLFFLLPFFSLFLLSCVPVFPDNFI